MVEKKDRRSKRDKLRDDIIGRAYDEIELMKTNKKFHLQKANENEAMIKILEGQIDTIRKLCEKKEGENKP